MDIKYSIRRISPCGLLLIIPHDEHKNSQKYMYTIHTPNQTPSVVFTENCFFPPQISVIHKKETNEIDGNRFEKPKTKKNAV